MTSGGGEDISIYNLISTANLYKSLQDIRLYRPLQPSLKTMLETERPGGCSSREEGSGGLREKDEQVREITNSLFLECRENVKQCCSCDIAVRVYYTDASTTLSSPVSQQLRRVRRGALTQGVRIECYIPDRLQQR
ncbi:hypothetical protein J6590_083973 [Homalodisca vitripennis]|nr:hypothetical protein J6590_083973 [Homalodisca vitripennis]